MDKLRFLGYALTVFGMVACLSQAVNAAPPIDPKAIPGSADVTRIKPDENLLAPFPEPQAPLAFPEATSDLPIPEAAKTIKFVLHQVIVKGATAFTEDELSESYASYLDTEITLETAYKIAADITRRYRSEGYFLSLATIPNQKIEGGIITIAVTEGYISEVDVTKSEGDHYVVDQYIDRVKAEKPLRSTTLESFLLQINDLPGWSYRGILSAKPNGEGAVKLTLVPAEKGGTGFISFDNFNSRFLGPHEVTASYSTSLIPFQQTTVSVVNSVPFDRLHYGAINQLIPLYSDLNLELGGSTTQVQPAFTLEPLEIKSRSNTFNMAFDYQFIRSRQQNLSTSLKFDLRNTQSDTLGVRITEDKIRALRASVDFDTTDRWQGFSTARVILSRGINGLGSSEAGELNLSRADAKPDFTKLELAFSRLQRVTDDWSVQARGTGQFASGALFSAEEYGYGGQQFGRAFDASELIGDEGVSGSLELRYGGLGDLEPIALQPFAFYDIGLVTNKDVGQAPRETASSIGGGIRFNTPWNQSGNLTASLPLIRDEATPIYGLSNHGPRISFQFTQGF